MNAGGVFIEDTFEMWPGIEAGWSRFCKHPAVACILEAFGLDLRRSMPVIQWAEWIAMPESERRQFLSKALCLLLDRQQRKLDVGIHINIVLFLGAEPISASQLDDDEDEPSDEDSQTKIEAADLGEMLKEEPALSADHPVEISRAVLQEPQKLARRA
jgi:hypothetical protein